MKVIRRKGPAPYSGKEHGAMQNMQNKIGKEHGAIQNKMYSIGPSLPLPDGSTTPTRPSLTSLFEWEAVTLGDVAAHDLIPEKSISVHYEIQVPPRKI